MNLRQTIPDFNQSTVAAGLVCGIIGVIIGFTSAGPQSVDASKAGQKAHKIVENRTGQETRVVSVEPSPHFYRVNLEVGEGSLQTYFVTREGLLMANSGNVLNPDSRLRYFREANSLKNCMDNKGAVLYGNSSQPTTARYLRSLGALNTGSIYKDVANRENLMEAANRNVSRTPSIYFEGDVLPGVNSISRVANFTGCEINR